MAEDGAMAPGEDLLSSIRRLVSAGDPALVLSPELRVTSDAQAKDVAHHLAAEPLPDVVDTAPAASVAAADGPAPVAVAAEPSAPQDTPAWLSRITGGVASEPPLVPADPFAHRGKRPEGDELDDDDAWPKLSKEVTGVDPALQGYEDESDLDDDPIWLGSVLRQRSQTAQVVDEAPTAADFEASVGDEPEAPFLLVDPLTEDSNSDDSDASVLVLHAAEQVRERDAEPLVLSDPIEPDLELDADEPLDQLVSNLIDPAEEDGAVEFTSEFTETLVETEAPQDAATDQVQAGVFAADLADHLQEFDAIPSHEPDADLDGLDEAVQVEPEPQHAVEDVSAESLDAAEDSILADVLAPLGEDDPLMPESLTETIARQDMTSALDDLDTSPLASRAVADVRANAVALDEEALRDHVATLVRDELRGELGIKITRNVRKLVRREIYRAIADGDLNN